MTRVGSERDGKTKEDRSNDRTMGETERGKKSNLKKFVSLFSLGASQEHAENTEKYASALEKGKDQARTKLEQQIAKRKERRRQQKLKELKATSKRENIQKED